ncbi:MAG: PEP-CTERM sorting domain-containing protein [Phycisphaerales bacterium]|nr:PEP-CTERM sorting domain-containing protein [Phycisphaerales bacterium]
MGVFLLGAADRASAAVTFTIAEAGGNVVITGSGSINTTGMTSLFVTGWTLPYNASDGIGVGSGPVSAYAGLTGPLLGPGASVPVASTATGDPFGFTKFNGRFLLPQNYVSGSPLFGTASYFGQSYTSMGFVPGTYVFNLNNGTGSDTMTVIIPAPGAAAMLGLGGMMAVRRRRR